MGQCFTPLVVVALLFVLMAFFFMQQSNSLNTGEDEDFYIGNSYTRSGAPYYTTTFQAYPGKYMNYSSTRESECLQRNGSYDGYRNCMLYLE